MAHKRRRARCPYCGHSQAVTASGRVWAHKVKDGVNAGKTCGGSGRPA
jgi:transcription elongation factor Elf1